MGGKRCFMRPWTDPSDSIGRRQLSDDTEFFPSDRSSDFTIFSIVCAPDDGSRRYQNDGGDTRLPWLKSRQFGSRVWFSCGCGSGFCENAFAEKSA